eukprot:TRINITY_DN6519_c0_g1_i1.p1 TRINITY_DN6519_c0_g1~~TRINITY_DN6519_c0_g1_i1.p1  ORF type:complete len:501 (-),score=103.13 TRINITY_DN6519_c0_g1_i1:610-2112(-)
MHRVNRLLGHLQPEKSPDFTSTSSTNDWSTEIVEIKERKKLTQNHGGSPGTDRQLAAGKLLARERIDVLLDKKSFRELGSLAGKVVYVLDEQTKLQKIQEMIPANFISGVGKIDSREVLVGADDFTVRGGHSDGAIWRKQAYTEQLARELRIPMVRLLDGSSGGGSVKQILEMDRTYVPPLNAYEHLVHMLGELPVACAVLGPVVGLGAARAVTSHYCVMVRKISQVFVAGPPVVQYATFEHLTKEELGGVEVHGTNGTVDSVVDTEVQAFENIRKFLSYLPSNTWELAQKIPTQDDPNREEQELLSIIPRQRRRAYEVRRIINMIFDKDTFFEIGENWAKSVVCGFARLDGYAVGVIASDCQHLGGALTAEASEKLRRHVDLCTTFHLPIVNLVDQPGFAVGLKAEKASTIRKGASAIASLYSSNVPWFTVIIRRAFGVGGAALVDRGDPDVRVAWPSGDWGSLPVEGGLEAAFKRQFEKAGDKAEEMKREVNFNLSSL